MLPVCGSKPVCGLSGHTPPLNAWLKRYSGCRRKAPPLEWIIHLKQDFHTLQWSNHCLGQAPGNAARQEFLPSGIDISAYHYLQDRATRAHGEEKNSSTVMPYLCKCWEATQGLLSSVYMLFTGFTADAALLDTILLRDCDL